MPARRQNDKNIMYRKGNILAIDTGSTTTKVGYFSGGRLLFEDKIAHSAEDIAGYKSVLEQDGMRRKAITDFLDKMNIRLEDLDIIMSRGGLITPVVSGVYNVNEEMREVLLSCRFGTHACNLSAVIADDLAKEVNEIKARKGIMPKFGECKAYIADPPLSDEMLPECRIGGLPEFPRQPCSHALNSKATVRHYLKEHGIRKNDVTIIVAHIGGGVTTTLHRNGKIIDTNDGLGGDGPITPERSGTCPAFPLIEMCFSGKYTESEVKKKVVGRGGAVAYFGTNDLGEVSRRGRGGDRQCELFIKAFCLSIAKYIASMAATAEGKVDAIIITGGGAYNEEVCRAIAARVKFIAPVEVYPGEHELESLAENGYKILAGEAVIHTYNKDRLVEDSNEPGTIRPTRLVLA